MNLVIRAHTLKNEPLSQPITGRFDERGGTIGRSDTNTLSLPDPERHISRLQAEVWFANGNYSIRNVGSANAIVVNGRSISPGEGASLANADEVTVGSYLMSVSIGEGLVSNTVGERSAVDSRTVIVASAAESKTHPPRQAVHVTGTTPSARFVKPREDKDSGEPTRPPAGSESASDPFADLFGSTATPGAASSADPFADLLGLAPAAPSPTPVAATPQAPRAASAAPSFLNAPAPPPAAPVSRLPDDFDPFADLGTPSGGAGSGLDAFMGGSPAQAPSAALPADIGLGDLIGSPTGGSPGGGSLDTLFGLNNTPAAGSGGDPLAAFMATPAPGAGSGPATAPPASQDPLAMFGLGSPASTPASPADALPADFNHTPELQGAYVPPAVQAAPTATTPAPVTPPKPVPLWPEESPTIFASAAKPSPATAPVTAPGLAPATPVVEAPVAAPPVSATPAPHAPRPVDLVPATTMPAVRPAMTTPSAPAPFDALAAKPQPMPPVAPAITSPVAPPVTSPVASPITPPAAAPITPPAPVNASASGATADALWAAFCEGAGVKIQPPQGLNPELMRMIGQILNQSVEGTLKLVAVRAAAKQELRAQVTTIQSRNNNPLKFSPDAAAAIEQLLQPPMRGFMFGPAAVSDVMDDLLGHAIGTMAGMRAALEGVLQRFEPKQLEGKLVGGGVIDALLPMNRRAKLWELYLQHYERIQGEAQDDFHDLFGKAFIKAYEDQLDLLDDARHPSK